MTQEVIAIDGVSYVGKSSIAKALSRLTGFSYINTGHMYRAIGRLALEKKISIHETSSIVLLAKDMEIEFQVVDSECRTIVDGTDWTNSLDHYEIVRAASEVAAIPRVREILTQKQQQYANKQAIIMEGRDIGSIVFPEARWKFFIVAAVNIRARRMYKMMSEEERHFNPDQKLLIARIEALDEKDKNREISPLRVSDDAIVYDNSDSPSADQDALVLNYYMARHSEILENARVLSKRENKESSVGKRF